MPREDLDPEYISMLARAFDRVWQRHYRHQYFDPQIAQLELVKQIVQLARAGERDEGDLALGGLVDLNWLTRALQRRLLTRRIDNDGYCLPCNQHGHISQARHAPQTK